MIIEYTQIQFQEFPLIMKEAIHVWEILVTNLILQFPALPHHRIISNVFISIDRVFHWLLNHIQCSCVA